MKNIGQNIKRIRESLGIKQDHLASDIGVNQQRMSAIESTARISDELLSMISRALGVPESAIIAFDADALTDAIRRPLQFGSEREAFYLRALEEKKQLIDRLLGIIERHVCRIPD